MNKSPTSEGDKTPASSELLLYQTEDGHTRLEARLANKTVWLSLNQLAELFQRHKSVISRHIKAIYKSGELARAATVASFATVQIERKRRVSRTIEVFNLDLVLAVGYRVQSLRGVQFRQWATARLSEFVVKGFILDDERLKNPDPARTDYFDEVLERIRDIRSSEKRMYLKVRDIFKLAADYEPDSAQTQEFFQIIQNKLHWAATGHTAPELIAARADGSKPNMGLTSWKGAKVRKTDVVVAKNYLQPAEIEELNRIVSMYLDYAEDQAKRRRVVYMKEWRERLDAFLKFNEREVLGKPGKVSREVADRLAEGEYEKLRVRRIAAEDEADERSFDEAIARLPPRK